MYEPEWLQWWRSLEEDIKKLMINNFFGWNHNPMNWMIKEVYAFHNDEDYIDNLIIKTKL